MVISVILIATISFSSCINDYEGFGISLEGMWKSNSYNRVIEFSGRNTMYHYGNVTKDSKAWSGKTTEPVPGHSGWFYLPSNKSIHTYRKEGNKIYTTDGDIFTYDGGRLLEDGSSGYFTRW